MKKYFILLLFISFSAIAQDHHFKAERKEVFWQLSFKTTETDILNLIDKNHAKVTVNKEDNTGKGSKLNCDCKGGGWYFEQAFDINFTVEINNDEYKVTVYDITFDGESEENTNNRLENYVLRIGQNVFHTTEKNKINMMCLDTYFTKLFKISNSEIVN
ncbi:hypothetical protein [Flavobacterium sp.]|uniref:hypothetical protein n=1 Tax=Flavobacterium sp. TaxID=239 RepID=UPI0037538695